jgi:hypothetical protein
VTTPAGGVYATETIAAAIRREVRLSAGIAEGQEFRCDWEHVAAAVAAALELREEWRTTASLPAMSFNDQTGVVTHYADVHKEVRWVSSWTSGSDR